MYGDDLTDMVMETQPQANAWDEDEYIALLKRCQRTYEVLKKSGRTPEGIPERGNPELLAFKLQPEGQGRGFQGYASSMWNSLVEAGKRFDPSTVLRTPMPLSGAGLSSMRFTKLGRGF